MKECDLVIGAVTGYNFKQIAPWVNSLDRSGFTGLKALVAYNMDAQTVKELGERGYILFAFNQDPSTKALYYPNPNFSIVVERFFHYYQFLHTFTPDVFASIRYVIATDVKDVIFQKNPSEYIDMIVRDNLEGLLVSSEAIQYKNEPWGNNNLTLAFGEVFYQQHKNNRIINAGVFSGTLHAFLAACKTIYLMSKGAPGRVPGGGGPDQAALNLFLANPLLSGHTEIATHMSTWAAQLGTTMDPTKMGEFGKLLLEPAPFFDVEKGVVVNHHGEPFTIVHQWDRVPEVRAAVERMYV